MATPMTASQIVSALRGEGVDVREYRSWRTHNRNSKGAWGPVNGIVVHHTAGRDSLSLCYNGTAALPGPLCHTHLSKTGAATMVGHGRANHAGLFAANAMAAMTAESSKHPLPGSDAIDANARTYGLEIENLGNGSDPYPAAQYSAAVRWAAGICRHHGWTADSIIGHKEGTRRKIDPTFSMPQFRADVAKRLGASAGEGGKVTAPAGNTSGGAALARYQVKINGLSYGYGAKGTHVTAVGKRLVAEGCSAYAEGPGPTWTDADTRSYAKWQRKCGYSGSDADGVPGETSLRRLMDKLPGGSTTTYVDLSNLVAAARRDPGLPQGGTTHRADALRVEKALVAEGVLAKRWADGSFGTKSVAAYAAWQRRCGYSGAAADGIPGRASLAKLGAAHGWQVKG